MKKTFLGMLSILVLTACSASLDNPVPDSGNGQQSEQQGEQANVADNFESRADWLATAYKKTKPMISSVWNASVNPEDFVLLFVREDQQKIYLIDDNGKQLVPQAEWPERYVNDPAELSRGTFLNVSFRGRNSCMILDARTQGEQRKTLMGSSFNPTEYALDLLSLFYHESFHEYVQEGENKWIKPPKGDLSSRDQVFPIVHEPRIYRKLMILSLVDALNNESHKAESYSRAKYWLNKFNTEFASEVASVKETDIHEGTAEYFGRTIVKSIYSNYPLIQPYDGIALSAPMGTEAYMLSIAINLAVREGRKDEVISSFEKGLQSPIEILLKDVAVPASYDESADKADRDRIISAIDQIYGPQSIYFKPLYDIVDTHRKGSNTYLVTKKRSSSMAQSMGIYQLTDADLVDYSCQVALTQLLVNIELGGCTILTHISTDLYLIPVDASQLQFTNVEQVSPKPHGLIKDVTITGKATLSECKSETVNVLKLPIDVQKGTDKFGNTLYFLQND